MISPVTPSGIPGPLSPLTSRGIFYRVKSQTIATSITAAVMTVASSMTASSPVFLNTYVKSR